MGTAAAMRARVNDLDLNDLWVRYEHWASAQGHREPQTVATVRYNWAKFRAYSRATTMAGVTTRGARRFHQQFMNGFTDPDARERRKGTANNAVKDMRMLWNRAKREGWYDGDNPWSGVEAFRQKRERPSFHTAEECERLLDTARLDVTTFPQRTYLLHIEWVIAILGWAGLRKGELAEVKWKDLHFSQDFISVPARKTLVGRSIPMHPVIKEALEPHVRDEGYVFPSMSDGAGRYRYEPKHGLVSALERAGLPTDDPFQRLRRSFGSRLVQKGVPIFKVAQWLGHSVQVCEKWYAGLTDTDSDILRL